MYNFLRSYNLNRANILNWTSANPDRLELPYQADQFLLDAHLEALPSYIPFDGDENDGKAIDAYCKRLDTVWEGCSLTVKLVLDFLDETPAAAFVVEIVQSSGERLECFGYCGASVEIIDGLIVESLRREAGLTKQAANEYRNGLLLHRLIQAVNGEPIPDDGYSHSVLDLIRAGQAPQAIAERIGAA